MTKFVRDRVDEKLRSETTVSLKWISQRLEMGTWTHVSNLLQRRKRLCQKRGLTHAQALVLPSRAAKNQKRCCH